MLLVFGTFFTSLCFVRIQTTSYEIVKVQTRQDTKASRYESVKVRKRTFRYVKQPLKYDNKITIIISGSFTEEQGD